MAPTEILAEQNHRKFSDWLGPLGVRIVWLHGGLSAADYVRVATVQTVTRAGIRRIGPHGIALAVAEGLEAHAASMRLRLGKRKPERAAAKRGRR